MHTGLPAASDLDRLRFLRICAVENNSALPIDKKGTGQNRLSTLASLKHSSLQRFRREVFSDCHKADSIVVCRRCFNDLLLRICG
jgi:hypothetical protein